ncbi:Prolyl-tRNA synthetase ProS [Mycobacteroides abscessus]|nr:Prolyl-tRNA synthetase ProS [Mycobacteroides abscessus]
MITRLSELFVRTLRDDPADAEVPSHKLLIRAGYVRPVAPGVYSWLPLGLRVLRKIENIVREEMNAIGGQEILLPALLPRAPYETTNRWTEYGDSLFRLKDRRDNDMMLGPTHEELFALTVKGEYSSYKDFPVILYQVQTKYRDEARPRAGILRGREFVMKDSYSFDTSDDGLKAAYHAHRDAYQRIFGRLGLDYVIVAATSGAMGGSASEEFLAESPTGEDTFVRCVESGYAANVEAVITPAPPARPIEGLAEAVVHETGDTPTIATLVDWANSAGLGRTVTAADTLKNILLKVRQPGGDWELLAVGVPGAVRSTTSVSERRSSPRSMSCSAMRILPSIHFWCAVTSGRRPCWPTVSDTSSIRGWWRAPAGSPAPTSRASMWLTSWPVATSLRTAPSRPPRCVTATPRPMVLGSWFRPAASRSAISSNWAASTRMRSLSTCSVRMASRCG